MYKLFNIANSSSISPFHSARHNHIFTSLFPTESGGKKGSTDECKYHSPPKKQRRKKCSAFWKLEDHNGSNVTWIKKLFIPSHLYCQEIRTESKSLLLIRQNWTSLLLLHLKRTNITGHGKTVTSVPWEVNTFKPDILGIAEMRWTGTGELNGGGSYLVWRRQITQKRRRILVERQDSTNYIRI